jgi:Fe-Mn family superoxide dismutase
MASLSAGKKILLETALRSTAASVHVRSSNLPSDIAKKAIALLSSAPAGGKYKLPDLPYDYNALEPVISTETMTLHHTKHHNAYVTNLNVALEKLDAAIAKGDVSAIIALEPAIRFNGGGHVNHALFWENLCSKESPHATLKSDGQLTNLINVCYDDVDQMKKTLTDMTVAIQGSGWGWLGYNTKSGAVECTTRPNQDPLEATSGLIPLLGIDVWVRIELI